MVVSEGDRRLMHAGLAEALGAEVADMVMEHLPPLGWADVARQADIQSLRTEIAQLGSELRGDLRGEMAELRGELRGEMAGLRMDLSKQMIAQTRVIIIGMVSLVAAVVGSMTGAVVTLGH